MKRRTLLQSLLTGVSGALLSPITRAGAAPRTDDPAAPDRAAPPAGPFPPAVFVPDPDAPTRISWWSGVAGSMVRDQIPVWGFHTGERRADGAIRSRQLVLRASDRFYHETQGWLHVFGRPVDAWVVVRPEQLGMDAGAVPDVDLSA